MILLDIQDAQTHQWQHHLHFLVDFELTYTKLDSLSIIDVILALDTTIENGVLIGNEIFLRAITKPFVILCFSKTE